MHALCFLSLLGASAAHFILHYPPSAGFDDDLEATSPCGSFVAEVNSSSTDVPVDQFAVFIQNVHPVGEWSFRATLNTTAPYSFVPIVPVVNTTGIGDFCLDHMKAPADWAGKPGIIQVVDNSPDGILYQCAPVNFVSGSNTTLGPLCKNATGFGATWTTLEGFVGEEPASANTGSGAGAAASTMVMGGHTTTMTTSTGSSGSMSMATSASATAAMSSSSSGMAAIATGIGNLLGGLGLIAAGMVI